MAREQEYQDDEEEMEEEEEAEEAAPAPVAKKPMAKKPMPSAKPAPKPQAPQVQYIKIPVFESQAQQIFYDQLLEMNAKLSKIDSDLELMKKYLPQE